MASIAYKCEEIEWLQLLPKELWPLIAKRLSATIDILRFRSTCRTWRSSTSLPPSSSSLPLFSPQIIIPHTNLTLIQTKLNRLQPSSTTPTPDSSNKGWIIMLGDSKSTPIRLLDPFTNSPLSKTGSPKQILNLLNFKFIELTHAYSLNQEVHHEEQMFIRVPDVLKVVLFPSSTKPRMVFALYKDGKLRVSKIGDVGFKVLRMDSADDGKNCVLDDLIIHMGQVYVVDKWGTILWVDSYSLKLVQFSPILCGFGTRKQLVVCGGSLYVVDMYIEGDPHHPMGMFCEVVGVRVYRLDEDWGRWLDVKELGDSVFIFGKDINFSVSAQDYYGCEGNCVYFYSAGKTCGFSLETSKFLNPNIFWPCPSLFHRMFNL